MPFDFKSKLSSELMFELEVATDLALKVDTPRSLTVLLLIHYQEWDQLVNMDIDPADYVDRDKFADDYLITKVLSKSVNIPTSYNLEGNALDAFFEGETLCRETNDRISSGGLDSLLCGVSHHIAAIVGPLTSRDLAFVQENFRNGPGATFGMAGAGSCPSDKFRDTPTLTGSLVPFARSILGDRAADSHEYCEVVPGNRFTTVPKTAKTDRGICIEPSLNVYVQLGIGALLRKRLRHKGIDLNDQGRNQWLAENAQSKELATIDLSLASDSVSLLLVYRLMPPEWFELLDLCRSPKTLLPDGTLVSLEKFSSMGNGYTFELESLIFAGICSYAGVQLGVDSHVYGDDIIVPRKHARKVIEVLEALGFRVNQSKTFLAGRFFESCGTDWFDSVPVRPFFLRKPSTSKIPYSVVVCNRLRLYAKQRGLVGCDTRFREIWLKYRQRVPKAWRLPVPEEIGDGGLIVSDLEHSCSSDADYQRGHKVRFVILRPKKRWNSDIYLCLHHLANLARRRSGVSTPSYFPGRGSASGKDSVLSNREIIRGYLGRPRTVQRTLEFSDGLRWV